MSSDVQKPYDLITDYLSGRKVPDVGAEQHRQVIEKMLVEDKGYPPAAIGVDVPVSLEVRGESYQSQLDLLVTVDELPFMVIKCAAGSLESRQKEVLAAARVYGPAPIPCAVVSNGRTAIVYDGVTRKKIGEGLDKIPSFEEAKQKMAVYKPEPVEAHILEREKIIFRSYDSMNLNVQRNIE